MPTGNDAVSGFAPELLTVAVGVTAALLVEPIGGQEGGILQYFSGGSCMIVQAPAVNGISSINGITTWAGASLINLVNTNKTYVLGSVPISYEGAPRFYIAATGATALIQHLRGLSPGF